MFWPRSSPEPGAELPCGPSFPELWSSFVYAITDTFHADGAVVARPTRPGPPEPTVLPAVERLVAIGDLHGDLHKTQRALRLAGLTDAAGRWVGGATVAVQVGDVLDRGDQEVEIFYYLESLQKQAAAAGGALHVLNGNHETMNAAAQFQYATPGGLESFRRWARAHALGAALAARCGCASGGDLRAALALRAADGTSARMAALGPGGPLALRFLVPHPTVLQVGSTVFVHGGLLPQHVRYGVERINNETREWLAKGPVHAKPRFLTGRHAVVWARDYSKEDASRCDCAALATALAGVPGAARMVVGHTIQGAGITSACGGRVLRIDVGLSRGCGDGQPEVLEIVNDREVRRLREAPAAALAAAAPQAAAPGAVHAPAAVEVA